MPSSATRRQVAASEALLHPLRRCATFFRRCAIPQWLGRCCELPTGPCVTLTPCLGYLLPTNIHDNGLQGFDALRQLYHDVHEPMWDSLSGVEPPESNSIPVREYQPTSGEADQPFPQAWPSQPEEPPTATPGGFPWLPFPTSDASAFIPNPTQPGTSLPLYQSCFR